MLYTVETLDRSSGKLTTVTGEWFTVSELGNLYGVGSRQIRAILHHMGLLHREGRRYRLTHAAVRKGFGLRHDAPKSGRPFDVISPLGQDLIAQAWRMTIEDYEADLRKERQVDEARTALASFKMSRRSPMTTQEEVCWLLDHFPKLTHERIGEIIGVTQQLVSRYARLRDEQKAFLVRRKRKGVCDLQALNIPILDDAKGGNRRKPDENNSGGRAIRKGEGISQLPSSSFAGAF